MRLGSPAPAHIIHEEDVIARAKWPSVGLCQESPHLALRVLLSPRERIQISANVLN